MLDIKDWRPDLGEHGKLHVRFGKGSRGRGSKPRLVPAINSVNALLEWWLTDVRHQFGDDYLDPEAPLFPQRAARPAYGKLCPGRCRRFPCRPGRCCSTVAALMEWPPEPARAASLLCLVPLCPGLGPEGRPGAAGAMNGSRPPPGTSTSTLTTLTMPGRSLTNGWPPG